jgi:hypothetical protein
MELGLQETMNWLSQISEQHQELESPKSFWYWSAIAALSAVVKDRVWLDRQIFKTYPNIYVMLHADSGLKKGPPIAMARQLVKPVNNTRIISGRSSIQGILKDLGSGSTAPGGKIQLSSTAFICSSELSSSIVEDKVATKILTDLYDRQYNVGEWRSLLKMETFELKDPTLTMLTATNEAMSEDFFTKSAIQGGYFARTFIIYEKESHISNSLMFPLNNPPNYASSADYLKEIAKLSGAFDPVASLEKTGCFKYKKIKFGRDIFFNEVGIMYDDWYENFKENVKISEHKDETGTMNRFGDSVLKVAMLLSLAEHPRLIITAEAMNQAIEECEKLLGNVRKTTLGKQGLSQAALLKTLIIMELLNRENHQVSRTFLMKKMWANYENSVEFDEMMQSFDAAGMIITSNIGNQIIYTMPETQVKELKEFMAGKQKKG